MADDAILRRCARCRAWLPIVQRKYLPNAKLCNPCWQPLRVGHVTGRELGLHALNRSIAITPKGQKLLRQWKREELMRAHD